MSEQPSRKRRSFDIDICDLSEEYVEQCAQIHAISFPEKIESMLGHACIADCLRTRYMPPDHDCYCRIAIDRSSGRVASYCHAEPSRGFLSNAFLSTAVLTKHLLRRGWYKPQVWLWVVKRIIKKYTRSSTSNEGMFVESNPKWEIAKMLAIHPDFRGSNVGLDLMLDNEAEARKRGSQRICGLIKRDNIKAERLYKSIGWVRTSPDTDKYDVFAMHRDLRDTRIIIHEASRWTKDVLAAKPPTQAAQPAEPPASASGKQTA